MTQTKTVLITGAGSGIGRALALEAARLGHRTLLAGRRAAPLAETAALIAEAAPEAAATPVIADITTPEGRAALVEAAATGLDVLINNAGTLSAGRLRDQSDAAIEAMIRTNLIAPVLLTRDLLPALSQARGRVVNVGSVFGDIAFPYFTVYSATKFGLRGFSDGLRRELAAQGVAVTHIAPRATRTAAKDEFDAFIEPFGMKLDNADWIAHRAWNAIERGKRSLLPSFSERFFVLLQNHAPKLVDRALGKQAASPAAQRALNT